MKTYQHCYGTALALACALFVSAAWPLPGKANEEAANANAQAAGERAHFARKFCGASDERIGAYKERLRKVLHDASNFDLQWQTGWHRGEKQDIQLNAMRLNDPKEFAYTVKTSCERIKWMATNAVRGHAGK